MPIWLKQMGSPEIMMNYFEKSRCVAKDCEGHINNVFLAGAMIFIKIAFACIYGTSMLYVP